MRNHWGIGMLILVLLPLASGLGFGEKLGIRLGVASIQSVSGSFNESTRTSDYLTPGMSYSVGIHHRISDYYGVAVGIDFGWMTVDEAYRENPAEEPAFVLPQIYFSNFVFLPLGRIQPYARLGASIVPWRLTVDGPGGDVAQFEGENFQKMSFGLHGGVGLELRLADWFALYGEGVFHYLLSRDRFFFGKGFTEQGILHLGGGILLYPFH